MAISTFDISEQSNALLVELTQKTGRSPSDVIEQALVAYRRQVFFEEMNAGYEALRADASAWAEHESERVKCDAAMADGLES